MLTYVYEGPIKIFGECVNPKWRGETKAQSLQKARNNLAFQYKRQTNRTKDTRVDLTGKIHVKEYKYEE